jgi:hypothetical protein
MKASSSPVRPSVTLAETCSIATTGRRIDNLLTGDTVNISHLVNRDHLHQARRHQLHLHRRSVDFVLHRASPASPIDHQRRSRRSGVALGTHKALGLAKAKGALSSPRPRGLRRSEHPQKETYWAT